MSEGDQHAASMNAAVNRARVIAYWTFSLSVIAAIAIFTTVSERRAAFEELRAELIGLVTVHNHADNTVREIRRVMQIQGLDRADEGAAIARSLDAVSRAAVMAETVRARLSAGLAGNLIAADDVIAINTDIMALERVLAERSSPWTDRAPQAVVAESRLEAMRLRDISVLSALVASDAIRYEQAFGAFIEASTRDLPAAVKVLRAALEQRREQALVRNIGGPVSHGVQLERVIQARSQAQRAYLVGGYTSTFADLQSAIRELARKDRQLAAELSGDLKITVPGQNITLPVLVIALLYPIALITGHLAVLVNLFHAGASVKNLDAGTDVSALMRTGLEIIPVTAGAPLWVLLSGSFLIMLFLLPDILAVFVVRELSVFATGPVKTAVWTAVIVAIGVSVGAVCMLYANARRSGI